MDKQYKPVPDVECLKYHGTPEKPDIKIFVSHRIDLDSETIDNPLYIPVRCGAVYDKREGVTMLGDDTGDNISEKRNSFCELTVQYWAWKNVEADYYGLCHYKRFLSFADEMLPADRQEIVHERKLGPATVEKHGLNDKRKLEEGIKPFDALISKPFDLTYYTIDGVPNPERTVYQYWMELNNFLLEYKYIEILLETIKEKFPDYYAPAEEYMNGHYFLGYNCFVMKKELFFSLCEFEFSILFDIENKIDSEHYSSRMKRTCGYLSEILYSIWVYKNLDLGTNQFAQKQLVMFEDTNNDQVGPHFGNDTISIVVMSSKAYAAFSAPFLQSVLDCTKSSPHCYEIIYLHHEIPAHDQKKLKKMTNGRNNIYVRFFNPDGLVDTDDFNVAHQNFAVEAYYRLFSPWILPDYKKALVLDIDIIVKEDPANLYYTPLNGCLAAGVRDVLWQGIINHYEEMYQYSQTDLPVKDPYAYVNTGVLLLDLERIRAQFTLDTVYKAAASQKYIYQEQDTFNVLFEKRIKYVDVAWNYYVPSSIQTANDLMGAMSDVYEDYNSKKNRVKILHFAAQPKPWFVPEIPYGDEFWAAARKTPYYEELLSRMIDAKAAYQINIMRPMPAHAQACTPTRAFLEKKFPQGTVRRKVIEVLAPWGSRRRAFCKQVYCFFHPGDKRKDKYRGGGY